MKQILCFGDSNTYGYVPKEGTRFPFEIRWTGILDKLVRDDGYRIIEEGLVGRTTVFEDPLRVGRKGAALLPTILESHKPINFIILMLGTNDCKTIYNASAKVIGKGLETLVQQILTEKVPPKVLLISPIWLGENVGEPGFDPEFNQESVEKSKKLKAVYRKIAKQYSCEFLAASDYAVASEEDREHMNAQEHQKLADAIYNKIQGWL